MRIEFQKIHRIGVKESPVKSNYLVDIWCKFIKIYAGIDSGKEFCWIAKSYRVIATDRRNAEKEARKLFKKEDINLLSNVVLQAYKKEQKSETALF